ncbi:PD40 domain-containing protein [Pajaroellobacter abortibovis]|uniref:TolB N-terminal domain-containing protein n=1 Tax=Pajaroellobacter abortibovis TaxID=1882918 RepID=A0A1L6MWW4_9BACT|nr:PD40 domain-containing protein [Pajaroellobacter abortibovis]APS00033.1 hypothetical protein BCY86_04550 [Pajaroellobacter abortibovis]
MQVIQITIEKKVTLAIFSLFFFVMSFQSKSFAASTPSSASSNEVPTVMVTGGNAALLKVALPPFEGDPTLARKAYDTVARDLRFLNLFQFLDPKSFLTTTIKEEIQPASWRNIGAEAVVHGIVSKEEKRIRVLFRLFLVSRGGQPIFKQGLSIPLSESQLYITTHEFANEVVRVLTGTRGYFETRLVYNEVKGKGISTVAMHGKINKEKTVSLVALMPSFGPRGAIYHIGSIGKGAYAVFQVEDFSAKSRPKLAFKVDGMVLGLAMHNRKMAAVTLTRPSNQVQLITADFDGTIPSGITRMKGPVANYAHPAFSASGKLAYVSDEQGTPQIFVEGKRISWQGTYNVAPAWCNYPGGERILFMGRVERGVWDVFSVSPDGKDLKRLTQNQGSNTYPACSPDGRMVAFFSTRSGGGIFLTDLDGTNPQLLSKGMGESLRWEQKN